MRGEKKRGRDCCWRDREWSCCSVFALSLESVFEGWKGETSSKRKLARICPMPGDVERSLDSCFLRYSLVCTDG